MRSKEKATPTRERIKPQKENSFFSTQNNPKDISPQSENVLVDTSWRNEKTGKRLRQKFKGSNWVAFALLIQVNRSFLMESFSPKSSCHFSKISSCFKNFREGVWLGHRSKARQWCPRVQQGLQRGSCSLAAGNFGASKCNSEWDFFLSRLWVGFKSGNSQGSAVLIQIVGWFFCWSFTECSRVNELHSKRFWRVQYHGTLVS